LCPIYLTTFVARKFIQKNRSHDNIYFGGKDPVINVFLGVKIHQDTKNKGCCRSVKNDYYHSTWVNSTLIILFAKLLKFSNTYIFRKKKFIKEIKNLMEHLVIYFFEIEFSK